MKENNIVKNKYLLTMMVAKRAKQLNQGFKPLLDTEEKNNRLLALREVQEGKVYIKGEKNPRTEETEESVS